MKTLTITDAKKNLGKWLSAAARGEDIGIISGADVIALRKVEVASTDYAWREYGVTSEELERYEKAMHEEYKRLKKAGKLKPASREELKKAIGLRPNLSSFGRQQSPGCQRCPWRKRTSAGWRSAGCRKPSAARMSTAASASGR